MKTLFPALALALSFVLPAHAAAPAPTIFGHKDWSLVCDNTRTCRAAGYQTMEQEPYPVSVLLTRKAGPAESVTAQLKLLPALVPATPPQGVLRAAMAIDGRPLGTVAVDRTTWAGTLSHEQVDALLAALAGTARITWSDGEDIWELSSAGATAVLLKMDEIQGRLGTTGALVRKGSRPDSVALPPLPAPVVTVPPLPATPTVTLPLARKTQLLARLRASLGPEDCARLHRKDDDDPLGDTDVSVNRLSNGKLLVGALCEMAAYNATYAWWLTDERPPYAPVLLPADGTIYRNGTIVAHRKGRGIGDCWEHEEWTWDGSRFMTTLISDGGPCRLIPGGWDMPSFVSTVRHAGN